MQAGSGCRRLKATARNKGRRIVLIGSLEPQPTRASAPSMRGHSSLPIDPSAPELGTHGGGLSACLAGYGAMHRAMCFVCLLLLGGWYDLRL